MTKDTRAQIAIYANRANMIQTQKECLLTVLKDFKAHTVIDLNRTVYTAKKPTSARLAARIYDLRKEGFKIASSPTKKNQKIWWYQLEETPKNKTLLKQKLVRLFLIKDMIIAIRKLKKIKCKGCGSEEKRHHAKRYCKTCYMREVYFYKKRLNKAKNLSTE